MQGIIACKEGVTVYGDRYHFAENEVIVIPDELDVASYEYEGCISQPVTKT